VGDLSTNPIFRTGTVEPYVRLVPDWLVPSLLNYTGIRELELSLLTGLMSRGVERNDPKR
jgi:hypothetical protein